MTSRKTESSPGASPTPDSAKSSPGAPLSYSRLGCDRSGGDDAGVGCARALASFGISSGRSSQQHRAVLLAGLVWSLLRWAGSA